MLAIPFQLNKTDYALFIVLQDENWTRMLTYDPGELHTGKFGTAFANLRLRQIMIGYANDADVAEVERLVDQGKPAEALLYLSRGWRFRPDHGDGDGPYTSLRKKPTP